MTTTTVPVSITCPDWCTDTAKEHAEMLWEWGGESLHYADNILVTDPTGLTRGAFQEPTTCGEVVVRLSASTTPDGRETADPVVMLDDREMSFAQAELLARALLEQVRRHRTWQKEQQR